MDGPGLVGPGPTGPAEIDRDRDRPRTDRSVLGWNLGKSVGPRSVLKLFSKISVGPELISTISVGPRDRLNGTDEDRTCSLTVKLMADFSILSGYNNIDTQFH